MTEPCIRSARPEDAPFLAWLMLASGRAHVGRGIWEVILDEPEDRCLAFLEALAVTEEPHLFHHSGYLVAEVDGRPAAGLGGYDPDIHGYPALQSVLPGVFQKLGIHLEGKPAEGQLPRIVGCVPPALEGSWVVDSVATVKEFRRTGLVSRLLEEILERGRERGFRLGQVNLYIGNEPARRAYEKHGFRLLDEWRDPYFEAEIGSPGMARMARDL